MEVKGKNNHVPVKERFGEEEKENTGLQQPSVSSQVKFGAAWADKKVFLTQMTPLCLNNHSVPMLEVQVLSARGGRVLWCSEELGQCCGLCLVPRQDRLGGGRTCLVPGQAWRAALV